jgi:hypothetical protein
MEPEREPLLGAALKKHSFLGNCHETDNGTMSVARQQILNKRRPLLRNGSE